MGGRHRIAMSDEDEDSYSSAGEDESKDEDAMDDGLFHVDTDFPLWADMNEAQKKQHSQLRDADEGAIYMKEFLTENGGIEVVAPLKNINWDSAAYTTQLDDTAKKIPVVRPDGVIAHIDSKQLKPGMIVRLAQDDKVPADVLIIGGDDKAPKIKGIENKAIYGRLQIMVDTVRYDGTIGYDNVKEYLVPGPVDETNVNDLKIKVNGYNNSAVLSTWYGDATINGEDYV